MIFEIEGIYHVFNQGNNRQQVFFRRENYLFFLKKIKQHVSPFADVLAWCLMPNHFHLMIYVKDSRGAAVDSKDNWGATNSEEESRGATVNSKDSRGATLSRTPTELDLNRSIGIMLASYTRAINKQENFSGSLFRKGTKAVCLNEVNGVTPSWQAVQGAFRLNVNVPEWQYPQICFNYIHNNPVSAGLVNNPEDWEFSSYRDFTVLREGKLINREKAVELGLKLLED